MLFRSTQRFAIKCSSITTSTENENSEGYLVDIDVFKDPITDPGKASKKGKVTTYYNKNTDTYFVDRVDQHFEGADDILETVFENGVITNATTLEEIRKAL